MNAVVPLGMGVNDALGHKLARHGVVIAALHDVQVVVAVVALEVEVPTIVNPVDFRRPEMGQRVVFGNDDAVLGLFHLAKVSGGVELYRLATQCLYSEIVAAVVQHGLWVAQLGQHQDSVG